MSVLLVSIPAHSGVGDFKHGINVLKVLIDGELCHKFDGIACVVFCSKEQEKYFSEELNNIAKHPVWNQKFQYKFIITSRWGHYYDDREMKAELITRKKELPAYPTHIIEVSYYRIAQWLRSYSLFDDQYFNRRERFIHLGEYGAKEPCKSLYSGFEGKLSYESFGPLKDELGLFSKRKPIKKNLDVFNWSKLLRSQSLLFSRNTVRCYVVSGYEYFPMSLQRFISRIQGFHTKYELLVYRREERYCPRDRE